MRFTSQTPDRWISNYARARRRARWLRFANAAINAVTVFGFLALFYFALLLCSILEPGSAPQVP